MQPLRIIYSSQRKYTSIAKHAVIIYPNLLASAATLQNLEIVPQIPHSPTLPFPLISSLILFLYTHSYIFMTEGESDPDAEMDIHYQNFPLIFETIPLIQCPVR